MYLQAMANLRVQLSATTQDAVAPANEANGRRAGHMLNRRRLWGAPARALNATARGRSRCPSTQSPLPLVASRRVLGMASNAPAGSGR
jgi:hypothetical protein